MNLDFPPEFRSREALQQLSVEELAKLLWRSEWRVTARDKQWITGRAWTIAGVLAGRGFGKALALDTAVPTPSGWTTMGELRSGDVVFDEGGKPCNVVIAHRVMIDRACYRVRFSDGSEIVADEDHLWRTWDKSARKAHGRSASPTHHPEIRTTKEIAATLFADRGREVNHSIECAEALNLPDVDLPIDPYLLGCWLGDGSSGAADITSADDEIVAAFKACGWVMKDRRTINTGKASTWAIGTVDAALVRDVSSGRMKSAGIGWLHLLRENNLLENKHVPSAYLRASRVQRLALLQGLLDTDGCIEDIGNVEFCNTNKKLADAVYELCVSLGIKATMHEERAKLYGRDCGPKWRIHFTPYIPVFRLSRKAARIKRPGAQSLRQGRRYIVAVDRVDSVPVRCITVDSPSRLYLVGRSMIPTHNTLTGGNWLGWEAADDPGSFNAVIAPTHADLIGVCFEGPVGLMRTIPPELIEDYNKSEIKLKLTNGALITGFSAEKPDRLRGPQHHRVWCDELAAWQRAEDTWDMMMFGLRLGDHPQVLYTTTPKPVPLVRRLVTAVDGKTNVLIRGTTYENRANLPKTFFDQLKQYEGTTLGRQELHGELIDPEESGIIKRSWMKIWSHDKPLPVFEWIVVSLDTAFTEDTHDKKTHDPDPTACSVWGAFYPPEAITYKHGERVVSGTMNVMLLECWQDHLGMPALIERARNEMKASYGPIQRPMIKPLIGPSFEADQGRKPDILLIEDKGSGISLRQVLAKEDIHAYAYNPGKASKLQRLHMVSHVFSHGMVWLVETDEAKNNALRKGMPKAWAEPLLDQICTFVGEGSIKHDDFVDATTQAMRLFLDRNVISVTALVKAQEQESQKSPFGTPLINVYGA